MQLKEAFRSTAKCEADLDSQSVETAPVFNSLEAPAENLETAKNILEKQARKANHYHDHSDDGLLLDLSCLAKVINVVLVWFY